jgi:RNA-directed DNA polymerase
MGCHNPLPETWGITSGLEPNKHYGKDYYSRYVVRANKKTINFTGFKTLLDEIKDVVNSYDPKDLD